MDIRTLFLFSLLPLLVIAVGCGEGDPRGEEIVREEPRAEIPGFSQPEFGEGRELDTLFGVNLDADTLPEYVVTSLVRAERFPRGVRADRLEIWDFDTASGSWRLAMSDTLLWLDSLRLVDLTADGRPEVVALTFAGGNDEVAGRGAAVYSGHTLPIRQIFGRGGGMPQVVTFEGRPYLLLFTQHWPEYLPHAAAVPIPDELLTFEGGSSRADFATGRRFFAERAGRLRTRVGELLERYAPRGPGGEAGLLPPAEATELAGLIVETIHTLRMADDADGLRDFEARTLPRLDGLLDEEQQMMIDDE